VAEFFAYLDGNVLRLHQELSSGDWHPVGYRTFWLSSPEKRAVARTEQSPETSSGGLPLPNQTVK